MTIDAGNVRRRERATNVGKRSLSVKVGGILSQHRTLFKLQLASTELPGIAFGVEVDALAQQPALSELLDGHVVTGARNSGDETE